MSKFPSKSGGGGNTGGVRLPSNTDKAIMTRTEDLLNELEQTLAMSIGNVFLNTKATVTNFAQLKSKASGKSLLLSNLEDIKNSIEKVLSPDNKNYKRTYNLIKHSAESLNKLSSETFLSNVIASNTPLTIDYTEKLNEIIETVKTSINNIVNLQGSKTVSASADGAESKTSATSTTLDINVSGLDKASLDTMLNLGQLIISKDSMLNANTLHDFSNALASIGALDIKTKTFAQVKFDKNIGKDLIKLADDIKKFLDKLSKSISKSAVDLNSGADKLNNSFKTVDTLFSTIEATNGKAKIAKGSLLNIDSTLGDIEKTAVGAEEKGKKAEKAQVNMANIGKFIMLCGLTMVIGAMFMMIPGMVKNALKFGLTLGVFIAAVLLPIALINKLADPKTFESAAKVKELIVTCGIIMLIGAAVMLIPGITKNTLLFGVTLGLFIASVLLPIALYGKISGGGISEANQLGKLIVTCSLVMLIGALFVTYANGKLVQACTQFGAVLGIFILMVLAPIMLYNMLSVFAGKSMEHLSKLIVSCTLVMMAGALFITLGGGKFVKAALMFGAVLGVFMLMLLAPLLLFAPLGLLAGWAIRQTEHLITKCVMLMMVGALFMIIGGGKLVVYSLAFGLALMSFITLIVTPIILFSFLNKAINFTKVLTSIATFIFVTTLVMMVGALFMQDEKLWKNALKFGALLDAFIIGVLLPVAIYGELLEREMKTLYKLALFITVSSACMLVGAMFVKKYGIVPVLEFATVLGLFVAIMGGVLIAIGRFGKLTDEGYKTMMQLNLLLIVSTACMLVGAAFIQEYGIAPIIEFGTTLIVFTALMGAFLVGLGYAEPYITPGKTAALGIALVIGAFSLAIIAMNVAFMLGGGIGNTLFATVSLIAIVGLFAALCANLSNLKFIKKGLIVAGAIGGVMTLLGVAIGAMNVAFLIGGGALETLKNVGVMALIVVAFGILLAGLSLLFTPAILGAIAAAAIAIPITLLGVAIGAMNVAFLIGGGALETLKNVGVMALIIVGFGCLMSAMALLTIPATLAAIAGGLIALPITLISVALIAMNIALMVCGGANKSLKNVQMLKTIVGEMPALFDVMIDAGLAAAFAVVTGALLIPAIVLVTSIVTMIGLAGKAYNSAGNINVSAIKKSIKDFLSITDVCPNIFKIGAITAKLYALKTLAWDINVIVSYIANSIKQFAVLQVATKWDSKGNPIRFKQLKQSDFETAANGVKSVILTLTKAIDEVTTKYPWIVKEDGEFQLKLTRLKGLSEVEGEILSTLCESLQSYARLLIPTKWDKDGKPIKFRPMVEDDFVNAANGVEKVMVTLAGAINTAWTNNTKIFTGDIIEKVSDLTTKEGEMLATLSDGLAHYANLMIPDKWNNKGVATHFTPMTPTQMQEAAQNIAAVMTLMAGAISLAWNGGTLKLMDGTTINVNGGLKDLESGGILGFGGTSVKDIMESLMPMGELVSSLAEGVAQYASLQIPDKWNAKGKPVHYKTILDSDFKTAASNIQNIITCTAKGVAEGYKALNDVNWMTSVDSILENIQPLGEFVSSIAEGVARYASLQIPTKWNAKGKPIQFVSLASSDNKYSASIYDGSTWKVQKGLTPFGAAAANIQSVITCLGYGVSNAYKAFNDSYDADEFKDIMEGFSSMGDFILIIASALVSYSKLQIANKWNANGKPIGFETMNSDTFAKASQNISNVVLGILFGDTSNGIPEKESVKGGLIGAWNILKDSYDPDELSDIINIFVPIGDLISSMAEGLANYAKLQIPTEWDEKTGKPVGFRTLTPTDFELAGTNIAKVLGTIANSVITYATENEKLFDGGADSIFGQTMAAVQGMGEMIKNIADGVNAYATGLIPWDWNDEGKVIEYQHVGDAQYNEAAKNIGAVLGVLGKSVIDFASQNEEYFDVKSGDSKFKIIMDSVSQMGSMIKDIAEGVNTYAQGGIPIWTNGKIVGYQKWPEDYFDKAGENIKKIITCVGSAVIELYNSDEFTNAFDNGGEFAAAIEAVSKIGNSVKGIADGVQAYANLAIPIGWDKDGKPTGYDKLNETDITKAKDNIKNMILTLGTAVIDAYNGTNIKDKSLIPLKYIIKDGKLTDIVSTIQQISSVVETTATIVKNIGEFKIPAGFDKDGKATGYDKLNETDITKAKDNITSILTNISTAINDAYKNGLFDPSADYIIGVQSTLPRFSDIISKTISFIKNITGNTEHFDKLFTYKQQSTVTSDNLTIGLFTDIYAILKDISGLSKVLVEFKDNKQTDIIGASVDVEILIDVITRFINKINRFNDIIVKNEKTLSELAKNSDLELNISNILDKLKTISNKLTNNELFANLTSDIQVKISVNLANIAALLTALYSTIQVIANEYNRNIDAINLIYDNNLFRTKSIEVYTKLTDIAKVFISDDIKSLNNLDKDKNDIIKSLNSVKEVTNTLFATVANIYDVFEGSKTQIAGFVDKNILEGKDKSVKKIISDIDKFASSITTNTNFNTSTKNLETLSNVINEFRTFISDNSIGFVAAVGVITEAVNNLVTKVIQEPDTADYLSSRLKPIVTDIIESTSILDVLRDSVTAVSVSQVIGETGEALNVLANGLNDVLTAIQEAQVKPQFKQNINELKAFIKETVNTLDSDKASQLTNLILALNEFMEKTGDIQGLTEAITNDLTVALDKITQKLDESNKAYELTERLQKSRHALIDNSIKKISSIMNKEIIVKVTAEMPPTQDTGTTPGEAVDKPASSQQSQALSSSNISNNGNPYSNNVKSNRGADQSNGNENGGIDYASANTLSRIDKKVDKIMNGLNLS